MGQPLTFTDTDGRDWEVIDFRTVPPGDKKKRVAELCSGGAVLCLGEAGRTLEGIDRCLKGSWRTRGQQERSKRGRGKLSCCFVCEILHNRLLGL